MIGETGRHGWRLAVQGFMHPAEVEYRNKDVLIAARFGREEAELVEKAATRANLGKSQWVRKTLLSAAGGNIV